MNALKRVWTIAATALWRGHRRPVNVLLGIGLPLFFGVVVSSLFAGTGDGTRAVVVDLHGGPAAQAFVKGLEATPMQVSRSTRADAEEQLAAARIPVAVVLPEDFSASVAAGHPHLELLHGPTYEPGGLVERRARALAAFLATGRAAPELPVRTVPPRDTVDADRYPYLRIVFGFYAMFALSTLMHQAYELHEERENGTLARMLALGVPFAEVVAGRALALLLEGAVQGAVMIGATAALGAPWLGAGLPALALSVVATLVCASGLALAVAGVTRTAAQVNNVAVLGSTAAAMLGGAFWPLDVVPAFVQKVGHLSPVYWAVDSLREAFAFGGPIVGQAQALAVLVLMGALGAAVGVTGLRRLAE